MATAATPQKSGTTTLAGVIAIIVSSIWSLIGGGALVVGALFTQADNEFDDFQELDGLGDVIGGALAALGFMILALGVFSIVLGAKVLQRRRWARITGIVFFSIYALLGLGALGGSNNDSGFDRSSNDDGAPAGLAIVGTDLLVVLLLALPSTGRDIATAEVARRGGGMTGYGYATPPGWTPGAPPPVGSWGAAPPPVPPTQNQGWGGPTAPPPPPTGSF